VKINTVPLIYSALLNLKTERTQRERERENREEEEGRGWSRRQERKMEEV
jgi:hypothetical protein